ncbi:MAG TPA: YihY/virulence factor BrkB family protein [Granulicella sp.]|jgi:YihY family inner membrane protein|nr:YihY/virulence factor BrkB family protein [Granulicella sp.]
MSSFDLRKIETATLAPEPPEQPAPAAIETLRPSAPSGIGSQFVELARYLGRTEVHTYAFSVAANVILSLFPFIVLLLTITRGVFHSRAMEAMVGDMMHSFLPVGQDFIIRNMQLLAHPRKGTQLFSLAMLLFTSTGVFLPLEVALNHVWGVKQNRSYLRNQLVSIGLAFAVGVLSMVSVAATAGQQSIVTWVFFGHTDNAAYALLTSAFLRIVGGVTSILIFFLIYWILPHRAVPARAVLPTAITVGILWEIAKHLYILALPWLDFPHVYGPFYISVGLMMWAFLSGLLLLAGAHFSATRYTLKLARKAEAEAALAAVGTNTVSTKA